MSSQPLPAAVPAPAASRRDEADLVAAAALACPAVVRLHGGGVRQVATYLPGRRVVGVRCDEQVVEVSVVTRLGVPVPQAAAQLRSALGPLAGRRPVDIHVADVADAADTAAVAGAADVGPGGTAAPAPAP